MGYVLKVSIIIITIIIKSAATPLLCNLTESFRDSFNTVKKSPEFLPWTYCLGVWPRTGRAADLWKQRKSLSKIRSARKLN